VQTSDYATISGLLLLHGFKLRGKGLKCWVMGCEYDSEDFTSLDFAKTAALLQTAKVKDTTEQLSNVSLENK